MLGGVENGASGQNDRLFLPEGTFTVTPSGQFLEEGTQPGEGNSKLGAGPAVCPQTTVEAEKAVMGVSWRAVQGGQGRQTAKDGEIGLKRRLGQKLTCQTHPGQRDWGPEGVLTVGRLSLSLETRIKALTRDSDHTPLPPLVPPPLLSVGDKWRIRRLDVFRRPECRKARTRTCFLLAALFLTTWLLGG